MDGMLGVGACHVELGQRLVMIKTRTGQSWNGSVYVGSGCPHEIRLDILMVQLTSSQAVPQDGGSFYLSCVIIFDHRASVSQEERS